MNTRLRTELQRLYHLDEVHGQARAMVLELARPADWTALAAVWQGVQTELALPAPAIAVSGTDGYQVWFSLSEPCATAQAMAFLEALRERYLRGIAPQRIGLMLAPPTVPALQPATGHWSAFVAPDLAPVFNDTPWLDIPPSPDGQADLLVRLDSIKPEDFQRALARLATTPSPVTATSTEHGLPTSKTHARSPRDFLLEVMNDERVELGLRIEAAKALLPYA